MECFAERHIMHLEPKPSPKWWEAIKADPLSDEWRAARIRVGAEHRVLEQCSIGRHFDCGDWGGGLGCECDCHDIAERAIMAAREEGDLP